MLDSRIEKKYGELEKLVRKYQKYLRISSWLSKSGYVIYSALIISALFMTLEVMYTFAILVFALTFLATSSVIAGSLRRKARVYRPDADDWILYHVWDILTTLKAYHASERYARSDALKREHLEKAIKSCKELLSTAEKHWTLGDFQLAKKVLGEPTSSILDNLRTRVLPSLERKDEKEREKTLKKVSEALYQFGEYLFCPTVEGLQLVNESMSKNLDSYKKVKLGYFERLYSFFATRATLKHTIIVILIFSLGFVPALCVLHFGSGSIDTAILTFATIFGPSIAVYFNYALKKEK